MTWLALLRSRLVRWLGLAAAALTAVAIALKLVRKSEGDRIAAEANKDTINRVEKGRAQVDRNRDDDPADRLRRNDGQW